MPNSGLTMETGVHRSHSTYDGMASAPVDEPTFKWYSEGESRVVEIGEMAVHSTAVPAVVDRAAVARYSR